MNGMDVIIWKRRAMHFLTEPSLLTELHKRHGSLWRMCKSAAMVLLKENPALLFQPGAFYHAHVRRYDENRAGQLPGMTLIGHPYAVLGRAEDIRTGALACETAQIPMHLHNLNGTYDAHLHSMHADFPLFDRMSNTPEHCANLFYLNADEMTRAYELLGNGFFAGRYNIGCFAWELSKFPEPWQRSFEHLQEVWAPTEFIRQALEPATQLPVIHMPFAIEPGDTGPLRRTDLGLPDDKFVFLFFFDFRSYVSRKNPHAVLEAFFQAFPQGGKEPVHLVIKVNGIENKQEEFAAFLQDERMRDTRIQIMSTSLDDRGIKRLVAACDCFVSLHRSEGFGRGLAEAMYYGKPVIATAYSGNMDFMRADTSCLVGYKLIPLQENDYPFWQGQVWADADVAQAAWYMRKLVEDPVWASTIGAAAEHYIKAHHSYRAVGLCQRKRLERIGVIKAA